MTRRGAESGRGETRRILVRCPNWLGDVVMATPGLRRLRLAYPDARIVAQLPAPLMPLLEGNPSCDEVWPLASRDGGRAGWWADCARIRAGDFDWGVVIPESISSALLMRLGGVRRTSGFSRDPFRRALLHDVVPAPQEWGRRRLVSKERFVLRLVDQIVAKSGLGSSGEPAPPDAESLRLELGVTKAEAERLDAALDANGVRYAGTLGAAGAAVVLGETESLDRRRVILAPGASFGPAKCWPTHSYAALGDRLAERGHAVFVVGGPGESDRVRAVVSAMSSRPVVLDACLDLGAFKALLQTADLLVANDAGARHVAAAFSVPSVIFFGPTSVAKTADHLDTIEVLETEHDCRPCYERVCPIDHRCMTGIDVDQAEAAAMRSLDRAPARTLQLDGAAS